MANDTLLRGLFVPIVTPFDSSGAVAVDDLEELAGRFLDAGAAGIVALGTTGESATLESKEKQMVVEACARACEPRLAPLVVGAGSNDTRASVAAARSLGSMPGVVACLTVVPYYVRPSEAGIVEHFKVLAEASPVPLVIYNIPYRTGRGLGPASILELARTDGVIGLKQATGALDGDTLELLAAAPARFSVLAGDDAFILPTVLLGGAGAIAASSHVCTEHFVEMIDAALGGRLDEGRARAEALYPVVRSLFAEPNPSVIKGVLHAQGLIPTADLRLPMTAASVQAVDHALELIEQAEQVLRSAPEATSSP
ncbi:MAG: 4-hydroxy-tetrahydrodipicolinate synthase [Acidimicrobiia bacterium]